MKGRNSLVWMMILVVGLSKLVIQSPQELKKQVEAKHPDGIPYSVANYGDVPFGKTMSGKIVFGTILQNCVYESLNASSRRVANKMVLSNRGDCNFTQKSLNSQVQGAKLAVIADNVESENPGRIILADDGRGKQIHIPTIFIEKELGDRIVDFTLKNQQVNILVKFETNKRPKAHISLWLDSMDRQSYILTRQLQPYLSKISSYLNMEIRHPTVKCQNCIETDCYMNNRYCKNTGFWGYSIVGLGQTYIKLQLREELIWKWSEAEDNFHAKWWEYMGAFDDQCGDQSYLDECSRKVMEDVNIDVGQIDKMMKDSFKTVNVDDKTFEDNVMLQKNRHDRVKSGLIYYPSIVINNLVYRGNYDAHDIFEMVCNSLEEKPEQCGLTKNKEYSFPWGTLIVILLSLIVGIFALLLLYGRYLRKSVNKDMNRKINQLVNQHIGMYEAEQFQVRKKNAQRS